MPFCVSAGRGALDSVGQVVVGEQVIEALTGDKASQDPQSGAGVLAVASLVAQDGTQHRQPGVVSDVEEGGPGPGIDFATAFPTPGTYGLFLDFQHRGVVRTATFTVESGGAPGQAGEGGDGHDH